MNLVWQKSVRLNLFTYFSLFLECPKGHPYLVTEVSINKQTKSIVLLNWLFIKNN
jgi:hypothetical protein